MKKCVNKGQKRVEKGSEQERKGMTVGRQKERKDKKGIKKSREKGDIGMEIIQIK